MTQWDGSTPRALRIVDAAEEAQRLPPAVQGEGGHSALFVASVAIVRGFALPHEDAARVLWERYNPRCVPPWSDAERSDFTRKVDEAGKNGTREWGSHYTETIAPILEKPWRSWRAERKNPSFRRGF